MPSIPAAIAWEILWRGRWTLIAAALGATALETLIFSGLQFQGDIDPTITAMATPRIHLHLALMPLSTFFFGSAVFGALGKISRLYAFPVPTSALVAWHLLPAMVAVVLESVLCAAFLNAAYHLNFPVLGPALFAAVALAMIQATLWWAEKSRWLALALAFVLSGLGIWLISRYGAWLAAPTRLWLEVTPGDVASLLAMAFAAFGLAVAGVARNRRGAAPFSLGLVDRVKRALDFTSDAGLPFRTPVQAQFWFEWRKKGWAMPVVSVFGLVLGVGGWLMTDRDLRELYEGLQVGSVYLSAAGLLCGLLMGQTGTRDADWEMRQFLATRPMTSADLAGAILKTSAKSVLLAWGLWAAAFVTLLLVLWATPGGLQRVLASRPGWWPLWFLPGAFASAWIAVNLSASAILTGRRTLVAIGVSGLSAVSIGLWLFAGWMRGPSGFLEYGQALLAVAGVVSVLGTAWAFVAARRRLLIGSTAVFVATGVWCMCLVLVLFEAAPIPGKAISTKVFIAGLAALAVAPLATVPLALAWNRSR